MPETQHQPNHFSNSNWSINNFFKRSIQLLKENPKLLLLSLAFMILVGSGSSGGNYNYSSSSPSSNDQQEETPKLEKIVFDETEDRFEKNQESIKVNQLQQNIDDSQVTNNDNKIVTPKNSEPQDSEDFFTVLNSLGIETNEEELSRSLKKGTVMFEAIGKSFLASLNRLSPWMKISFPIEILVIFILIILFGVAVSLWIRVAMMSGIDQAAIIGKNQWKLVDVTKKAGSRIKPMIWMSIIPWFKIFLWSFAFIVCLVLMISGIAFLFDNRTILGLIFSIGGFIATFYSIKKVIKFSIAQILGYWNISINDPQPAKIAFKQSLNLLNQKGSAGKLISLAFVHFIIFSLLLPLVALLPLGSAGFTFGKEAYQSLKQTMTHSEPEFSQLLDTITKSLSPQWIIILVGTGLLTALLLFAVSLITTPIKHANWYWAYQHLLEKSKNNIIPKYQEEDAFDK